MSVTEPSRTTVPSEVRARSTDNFRTTEYRETKPSFMTTEFWVMILGIAALIVLYNAASDASLNLWRTTAAATALAIAYMFSRGFAKSGTGDRRRVDEY